MYYAPEHNRALKSIRRAGQIPTDKTIASGTKPAYDRLWKLRLPHGIISSIYDDPTTPKPKSIMSSLPTVNYANRTFGNPSDSTMEHALRNNYLGNYA